MTGIANKYGADTILSGAELIYMLLVPSAFEFDKEENELLESYHQKNLERASEIQMNIVQLVRHLDGISFPENYRILSKVIGVDSGEIQRHFYNLNDVFCYQWIEQMTILVQKLRMS